MRVAPLLLASLALFAPTATWAQQVQVGEQTNDVLPGDFAQPTMLPPTAWGGPTSIPTAPVIPSGPPRSPGMPTYRPPSATGVPTGRPPHDGRHGHDTGVQHGTPVQQPSKHYCNKYLEHVACRQCVTAKGSLGFTPNADLHWCPTPGTDHYDHLGSCQLITTPCASSLSVPITNMTLCPNDAAASKPSCGACTGDAYVWCQSDDKFDDEYMGICKDASTLFSSRAMAEFTLRQRKDNDDNTYDIIDQLCGLTHTAIISRKHCPRKHRMGKGMMLAILFHLIPILLCLSACCLCVRAIKRRRAARRQALLDVTTTTAPSAPSNEYPGVVSTTYESNAPLPVPLPNGTYVAPAATAPVPMTTYPTLRAPLLQEDGLIYGQATAHGYQRVHQEI